MKLRINGNSIRMRVTQSEIRMLADEGLVNEVVEFGPGKPSFGYTLELSKFAGDVSCEYENDCIRIVLPEKLALDWCSSENVGIASDTGGLRLLVEKDFMCLKPRPGEDESDMFPNPDAANC